MQTIRSNLTRIKNKIEEKFPEGNDIFGFQGISKEQLISCVEEAYQLSYKLADLEPQFEITILKRKIAHLMDSTKEYLSKNSELWGKEKKFDQFVTDLTKIREEIRLTYLTVIDKSLRTEAESQQIISDYKELKSAYIEHGELFKLVQDNFDASDSAHENIIEMESTANELSTKIENLSESISAIQKASESSFEFTSKYEVEAKERKQSIDDIANTLNSMETKAKSLNTKADTNRKEFEKLKIEIGEQFAINESQQAEIQNTLDNANRMGMAGSFKSRKDELNKPIMVWAIVFGLSVFTIFGIGYYFLSPYVDKKIIMDSYEILIKIALVSPFVWLAWMSVKQYGYLSRIREDYAYKYASAMAFEGYKKHALDVNEDLLEQLLRVSIDNLSQNPIRLFDSKNNHGSPAHELVKDTASLINSKADDAKSVVSKIIADNKSVNAES